MPNVKRSTVNFPQPYWSLSGARLYLGDVRKCLAQLPSRSIHCCVTSPPYWGLRDYGICSCAPHIDPNCELCSGTGRTLSKEEQIGSEISPDCYTFGKAQCGDCFVCTMVSVFSELKRVLRDDGVLWVNLGDTYGNYSESRTGKEGKDIPGYSNKRERNTGNPYSKTGLPSGNLVGCPWRTALALQADGWVLRQDVIWAKVNTIPESMDNRCTKSHDYIFMLTKSNNYFFDNEAIRESSSANKRDVWWELARKGVDTHFATFSKELITPCILSSTSEYGCCAMCQSPYTRVVVKTDTTRETVGWQKSCRCRTADVVPCTVLDPFVGSGTTVVAAIGLDRHGVGIDVCGAYLDEHAIPRITACIKGGSAVKRKDKPIKADVPPRIKTLDDL